MTKAYLEHVKGDAADEFQVRVLGHATGSREVCAAVSCLVYTLAGWLGNACDVKVEALELDDDARAVLRFRGGLAAETAFDMVCVGFLQLARQFPECVSVEIKNFSKNMG